MSDTDAPFTPIQPTDLPIPAGAYSPGVRAGNLLFVAGQVPRDPATGAVVGDDIGTQTAQVLANLDRVLAAAGATRRHLVQLLVHLADVDDWAGFDAAYRAWMTPPYPTRTVVGAALRGIRVEVTATAVLPG